MERFFLVGSQPSFHLFQIFGGRKGFRSDSALKERIAHCLIVCDMFFGDSPFGQHLMLTRVVDGDFRGEIFGLENDGGREIGQRPGLGHIPLGFHGLSGLTKEGMIAFGADECEVWLSHNHWPFAEEF